MNNQLDILIKRYPQLSICKDDIIAAYKILEEAYSNGNKLLVCGNGGSASEAEHIICELMKGFNLKRNIDNDYANNLKNIDNELGNILANNLQGALPAISLNGETSLQTAFINDMPAELIFAQQINGYGNTGDVLLAISTSGNSKNILYAAITAKAKGLKVIGLTGITDNKLIKYSDICIKAPETETYKIQELHLPIHHCLCLMLEEKFFNIN